VPLELSAARSAFQQVSTGPAGVLVAADLRRAEVALREAETAFKDDHHGFHTLDLAYVAQRKAELAGALASSAAEARNTAYSNAQYQSMQDAIMLDTKEQLDVVSAQLIASENGRALAEERANDAMTQLANLASIREETRGLVITLSGSELFHSNESVLLQTAQTRLAQIADALLQTKERSLTVEGHTDSSGSAAYNLGLSQRRADAAVLPGREGL